ncbi:MAG: DUF1080 domain-containing protein [Opitutales bacterium]
MKKLLTTFTIFMAGISAFAQKDNFAGFYAGKAGDKEVFGEVFRSFDDTYRLRLYTDVIKKKGDMLCEVASLKAKDGVIEAKGDKLMANISATEINGELNSEKLGLVRFNYVSKTMGEKAPANAVILFDGKDLSKHWVMGKRDINWIIKDGVATIDNASKSGTINTKEAFGASKLHFEFKTPAVYNEEKQQKRGNSGVKFGPYEIQILDSFGTAECNYYDVGSVYSIYPPAVNSALEPDAWQSYDIEFTPVKYDADGKILALPRFTVYLNGVLVQDNVEVPTPTNAKQKKDTSFKHPEKVELQLQNHQHDVSFRNIWLVEL